MVEGQKKTKAIVILKADCIKNAGLENTFPGLHNRSIERLILAAFDYNLEDSRLAELRIYPKILGGRWMRLSVPKDAILAIVNLEDSNDKSELGFKAEEIGDNSQT